MSNRLDKQREALLQPKRMEVAVAAIQNLGFTIDHKDDTVVRFKFKGFEVSYYPYSGWASGVSIKDGRGLEHLINQIRH